MIFARHLSAIIVSCVFLNTPALATDKMKEAALKFIPTLKSECDEVLEQSKQPEFVLYQEKSYDGKTLVPWLLGLVPCNSGAYNFENIWLIVDKNNVVKRASFSVPQFEIKFEENGQYDKVKSIRVSGYSVQHSLTNSQFDTSDGKMRHSPKGRGIGDIYDHGVWRFQYGDFILETYETDPTGDGEINPAMKLDFTK